MNWKNIRPIDNSRQEGFEELVCQLARKERISNKRHFVRKGKPDAGVECFWILENDNEIAWQAKFFTERISSQQWGQIDKSVKNALTKHPNLIQYFIALPNDPSDAKLDYQTSMLEQWDKHVAKWEEWSSELGMTVKFTPWWSSDMIERLQYKSNSGILFFWFNQEEITDEWLKVHNNNSIISLGKRYVPENHISLEISELFDGVSRDEILKDRLISYIDRVLISINNLKFNNAAHSKLLIDLGEKAMRLNNVSSKLLIEEISENICNNLIESLNEVLDKSEKLYEELILNKNNIKNSLTTNDYDYLIYKLRELNNNLYDSIDFFESKTVRLSYQPFLLIEGDAGTGKSHLLADSVKTRELNGKHSLLFLGQDFVTNEDPWYQILKKLHLRCDLDEFLGALNAKGEASKSRFILYIDALNEGKGRFFWPDNLTAFIARVSSYNWIGLVLSVRSSYINLIAPKNILGDDILIRETHQGFGNLEYEASKVYFTNYNIELPRIPLLHPEFQNPLFLRLFCEGLSKSGKNKIPEGLKGITSIINFFVDSCNEKLSRPIALNYPSKINLVRKAIEALMSEKVKDNLIYIEYERAYEICEDILSKYSKETNFLDTLISEGILAQNCYGLRTEEYEEGVYLTYERFEDHIIVSHLLNDIINPQKELSKNGRLYSFIKDDEAAFKNRGLIDALSIQLPEKFSIELFEYTKHLDDQGCFEITDAFINSLLWRNMEELTETQLDFINSSIMTSYTMREKFLDTLIALSGMEDHPFNAEAIHKYLDKFSMADRDSFWSAHFLRDQFQKKSSVRRLIDWGLIDDKRNYVSDKSIFLISTTIIWFLCCVNRELRDLSTKSLINILQHRPHLLINLIEKFKDINDPYIYERIFAIVYGVSLRMDNKEELKKIGNFLYETIFKEKDEIYPHILLRDYVRSTIEFAVHNGIKFNFDLAEIRPPYRSEFPKDFLSNEELDEKYEIDYKSSDYKEYQRGQNVILRSMTTEYGRGGGYGDFGRYTFQSALTYWSIDPDRLSNKAVEWIFEKYGYDVEKHGHLDTTIPYTGRGAKGLERIGKKYQWIAFYEMLARVSDNVNEFSERGYHLNNSTDKYEGPWNPYVRDFDPTILTNKKRQDSKQNDYWWVDTNPLSSELAHKEWLREKNDIPKVETLINLIDNEGVEWLMLEGYPEWSEKRKMGEEKFSNPHKRLWLQIRSYLIKRSDYKKLIEWSKSQDFWGRWMPESSTRYEVFNREYYWSPAYKYFQKDYYGGGLWSSIYNGKTNDQFEAMVTAVNYLWEEEFDFSKDQSFNYLKPNKDIFEGLNMRHSEDDTVYNDEKGNKICFDPSAQFDSENFLLVRKKEFIKYLNDNELEILWTAIGEKLLTGGSLAFSRENKMTPLEISGSFWLKDEIIDGKYNFK